MATIRQIFKAHGRCLDYKDKMLLEVEKLGAMASEYLGFEVKADLCGGGEIEFRPIIDKTNDAVETSCCWIVENLPAIKQKFQRTGEY